MAVFLVRALGEQPSASTAVRFSDVASDTRHAGYMTRLAELGITSGFSDGTFRPDESVTRAQMASFLVSALGNLNPGNPNTASFSDVSTDNSHAGAIAGLAAGGVTSGYGDGTFRPGEPVTRAQMASFLAKALGLAS